MTLGVAGATALFAAAGVLVAGAVIPIAVRAAPPRLVKTNISRKLVPAVLGAPLMLGAWAALALLWGLHDSLAIPRRTGREAAAVGMILVVVGAAGLWDDLAGRDSAHGFAGHLGALRSGRVTSGTVKMVAAVGSGLLAGLLVARGARVVETALLVGLTANLVNLLDRAPGRAAKVSFTVALALVAAGSTTWSLASAGLVGALTVCLAADLEERAMLGDAGANALGAALGLGLAGSLGPAARVVAVGALAALNLASERWSFSSLIEQAPWLRALDRLGRVS